MVKMRRGCSEWLVTAASHGVQEDKRCGRLLCGAKGRGGALEGGQESGRGEGGERLRAPTWAGRVRGGAELEGREWENGRDLEGGDWLGGGSGRGLLKVGGGVRTEMGRGSGRD